MEPLNTWRLYYIQKQRSFQQMIGIPFPNNRLSSNHPYSPTHHQIIASSTNVCLIWQILCLIWYHLCEMLTWLCPLHATITMWWKKWGRKYWRYKAIFSLIKTCKKYSFINYILYFPPYLKKAEQELSHWIPIQKHSSTSQIYSKCLQRPTMLPDTVIDIEFPNT